MKTQTKPLSQGRSGEELLSSALHYEVGSPEWIDAVFASPPARSNLRSRSRRTHRFDPLIRAIERTCTAEGRVELCGGYTLDSADPCGSVLASASISCS